VARKKTTGGVRGEGRVRTLGELGMAGGSGSIDEVAAVIEGQVPSGQTYRGISAGRFQDVLAGAPLISVGAEMLPQAGRPGELQTTDNLRQALAHAEGGVVVAIPRARTVAKRSFADIRRVRGGRLSLDDLTAAFDAKTGVRIL